MKDSGKVNPQHIKQKPAFTGFLTERIFITSFSYQINVHRKSYSIIPTCRHENSFSYNCRASSYSLLFQMLQDSIRISDSCFPS